MLDESQACRRHLSVRAGLEGTVVMLLAIINFGLVFGVLANECAIYAGKAGALGVRRACGSTLWCTHRI